jgi:hypothetical protein
MAIKVAIPKTAPDPKQAANDNWAEQLIKGYATSPVAQPQPDTQIGDIASGVQQGWKDNGIVGAVGSGITNLAKYANTPQGMKLMGLVAQQQGGYQGRDVAEAYYGQADTKRNQELAAQQYANEQEKERVAAAAPVAKTTAEQAGENTRLNTTNQATSALEAMRQKFTGNQSALERKSQVALKQLEDNTQMKIASMTDDRAKQQLLSDTRAKVYAQVADDAKNLGLTGQSYDAYISSRLQKEHPNIEWGGIQGVGGGYRVRTSNKVMRTPTAMQQEQKMADMSKELTSIMGPISAPSAP